MPKPIFTGADTLSGAELPPSQYIRTCRAHEACTQIFWPHPGVKTRDPKKWQEWLVPERHWLKVFGKKSTTGASGRGPKKKRGRRDAP